MIPIIVILVLLTVLVATDSDNHDDGPPQNPSAGE